jgi:subtilisin family serine protease
LEPQSQMAVGSHGTHVASIVAGNRGICRRARIAAVLISIPQSELGRRESFYDSTRLAHAVDYLLAIAEREGLPISINISLGTNGHAHDDSSPVARWIDASLARPGRCVSIAAGNAGQERAEHDDDIGWTLGRIHSGGRIPARELVHDIEWNVVGNGSVDLSENELEVWYGAQDRFSVQVKPPGGALTEVVRPHEYIENRKLPNGSFLSVYNELYHPANGANLIAFYLSPQLREAAVVGVLAGQWLIRLIGDEVRDGGFHCWIERDDPRHVGRIGERDAWAFPSFFSERSFVDASTISSLACGPRIVAVANLDRERRRINLTSSQGPTRDGREKPDIAAPGTGIVAAKGFDVGERWIAMTGTSMASPHVAGVAGLMLAMNRRLTSAQIGGILKRTARPLPGADFTWRDDAGAGEIDEARCLTEATRVGQRRDIT